ncbi:alpha-amylase family glycosyl hydrolase [Salegentibacter salegens]|uniref:Alpha amylase, catalytic domain n=1 Tax=Salegentibacter salegens TaxID=143223 RepID=A0A1M7NYL8_9FLAO|nr:alpha-amylase family glycosyl hydrolase [Salegentibacter salegens]PRX46393.1 alpha amylase catalytic subunit [Salegentibacter salegens]SHN09236.1 Alpha amylase, catalytic domain [Salegentibacter salegens]
MKKTLIILLACTALFSCKDNEKKEQPEQKEEQKAIDPVSNESLESAVIYEANIRQYSPEGTFDAFTKDIPQLKELGVKVIWLMPVYPISMKNRKATGDLSVEDIEDAEEREKYLGSYYAISDYTDVNPEFGDFEDFEELVETAHENGMYVILDWVANHTGWDHKWIEENPDYYHKNSKGEVTDPINPATGESWGWTDVAHLNFENKELLEAMGEEMKFWVEEYNIDGFRADVAGEVPTEFWESIVPQLKEIKPIFMLAESEDKDLFENAFDMGYNWEGHHIMNEMAQGKKTAKDWDAYMHKIDSTYQEDDYLMSFVTNHDENSWNGTVKERMGDASEAMMALTYTLPGMPLIYSGQEYDMDKRLLFFEKDTIPKEKGKVWPLLEKLGELKNENKALHGAKEAASYENIETSEEEKVLAFKREKDGAELIYIANMSDENTSFSIQLNGTFENYLSGETLEISEDKNMDLESWQYFILINK